MLKTRLITGSALFIVFIPILFFAPAPAFSLLLIGLLGCAAWEWARLLKLRNILCVSYALVVSFAFALSLNLERNTVHFLYLAAVAFWIGIAPLVLARPPKPEHYPIWRLFLLAAGPMILIASGHALSSARLFNPSFAFSVLLFIWAADSGAYFTGKWFGKHKLAPSISPGKSWEGVVGGVCLAFITTLAMRHFDLPLLTCFVERLGISGALFALAAMFILSVVGDLFESLLKRQAGMKDSSALLPGHGGVLDRIDALLPVLPFALLLVHGK